MKPSKIEIHNYRKLSEVTINLTNHMNVIFGENATGKSTIIQLIYDAFHCTKYGSILNYDTTSGTALIKIHSDDTVLRSFTRLRDIFNHYLYPLFGVPGFARAAYNTCSFINANLTVRLIKPNSYTPKQYEPFISSIVKEIYPQFNKFINYNLSTGERALYNLINKIHTYTTCAPTF
jgi:energy-coupling factor transporter ATP-binding protein EcfA2